MEASYVLPLHRLVGAPPAELTAYLAWLAPRLDLVVVDDSAPDAYATNARAWETLSLRHVPPSRAAANPKVAGVLTGVALARHDRVVLADDDIRYSEASLADVVDRLGDADLVRPQNFFSPTPWHARWDTGRTLLNRALGRDYPGTLAVRRSTLDRAGGYDGDVLFENLELIRTVEAVGGVVTSPPGCYVARRPPTVAHFWSQRVRQAYDDLAQPTRLAGAVRAANPDLAGPHPALGRSYRHGGRGGGGGRIRAPTGERHRRVSHLGFPVRPGVAGRKGVVLLAGRREPPGTGWLPVPRPSAPAGGVVPPGAAPAASDRSRMAGFNRNSIVVVKSANSRAWKKRVSPSSRSAGEARRGDLILRSPSLRSPRWNDRMVLNITGLDQVVTIEVTVADGRCRGPLSGSGQRLRGGSLSSAEARLS
jgi:hypothetical protein